MKRQVRSNIPMIFLSTGLIFVLLLLTMILSNGIIILAVNSGLIKGRPDTPLIPFLIQTGILSVCTGVILTLALSHIPLRPVNRLNLAIHAVAEGDFHTKINLKHPKELRELSKSFNKMTDELAGIEMLHSDFINNFSHEFRTPIMSVMGFARLIKKGNLSKEEQEEYLDIIISECGRLAALSSNVLSLTKVESITRLRDVSPCNAAEQIRESILQLEQKWEKKGIFFELNLEDRIIPGSPDLLKQVWVNLIDNAVKFSPPFGSVSIRAGKEGENFTVRITDNGIGMDKETQKKVFDKFYQGDLSHSTEGNGLGLSLVQKIIRLHRGSIQVESIPDCGSTFTVSLPE